MAGPLHGQVQREHTQNIHLSVSQAFNHIDGAADPRIDLSPTNDLGQKTGSLIQQHRENDPSTTGLGDCQKGAAMLCYDCTIGNPYGCDDHFLN